MINRNSNILPRIRILLIVFSTFLVLSGLTAFPLHLELSILHDYISGNNSNSFLAQWITNTYVAVNEVHHSYPFLAYGTDWLAFAHIVIATAFIGPIIDPVKNIWVIQFGMIACVMVFPLAFIAGNIRGIPFIWQLIDCSFGVIGLIPLYLSYKLTKRLEHQLSTENTNPLLKIIT